MRVLVTSFLVMTLGLVREAQAGWEWGPCPKASVKQGFSVDQYSGIWYERFRDKSVWYEQGDCVQAKYTKRSDGSLEVRNTQRKPGQSSIKTASRAARATCKEPSGQCYVSFYKIDRGDYAILDTDFTNYAVVKECENILFGLFRQEFVWILTRTPTTDTTAALAALTTKYPHYDQNKNLKSTFQSATECPYPYT